MPHIGDFRQITFCCRTPKTLVLSFRERAICEIAKKCCQGVTHVLESFRKQPVDLLLCPKLVFKSSALVMECLFARFLFFVRQSSAGDSQYKAYQSESKECALDGYFVKR